MKISVIVPVYNSSKYINKLIKSVINQEYDNYELILVDDGSTDESYNIMQNWADKNKKIKVFKKENTGPGLTRKFGFEKSTGDLIFFVDSDDWVTDIKVFNNINNIFEKNNNLDVLFFDREDIVGNEKNKIKGLKNIKHGFHNIKELKDRIRPGLGSKILKRNKLNSNMFIESNIFEDLYTTFLYLDKCETFFYTDKCFYTIFHEKNSKSLSSVNNVEVPDYYEKSLNIVLNIYKNIEKEELKYCLSLLMSDLFLAYCSKKIKRRKDFFNSNIQKNIYEIAKILNRYNIICEPQRFKIIKKLIYYFELKEYKRKYEAKENKKEI